MNEALYWQALRLPVRLLFVEFKFVYFPLNYDVRFVTLNFPRNIPGNVALLKFSMQEEFV